MDAWTQWTTIALIGVTAVSTAGVLGQFANQRRQRRLAEAEAHVQQAKAWAALTEDWERCVLVVAGDHATWLHGLSAGRVREFRSVVERYRLARVAWNDILGFHESVDEAWQRAIEEESQAREGIVPYAQSVQRIVTHLAQVSSLILRKQLTVEAVYGALGPACLRVGDDLINVLKMGYAHNDGCVAPDNMERRLWALMTADQVVGRLGWGDFLDVARGTAERVFLLLDLLKQYALQIGDLTEGPTVEREHIGAELSDIERLAIAWRGARPFGLIRTLGIVLQLAAAGRAVQRRYRYFWNYPARIRSLWNRFRGVEHEMPRMGSVRWLLDTASLPVDLVRAARRANSVRDIRWLEMPEVVEDRLKRHGFVVPAQV